MIKFLSILLPTFDFQFFTLLFPYKKPKALNSSSSFIHTMKATIVLDKESEKELNELKTFASTSKSELIREAIRELYFKEKRARENLLFFVNLYNEGIVTKDLLFLLLPRKDAEAAIIGAKTGKEAAEIAKKFSS